jgi:membrane protein
MVENARDFFDEKSVCSGDAPKFTRLQRFAFFWLLVGKSFNRNRCPVRAASLAYTTLLALVPMLVVALSVSSSLFKGEAEPRINQLIDRFVDSLTPPATVGTNGDVSVDKQEELRDPNVQDSANPKYLAARKQVAGTIESFINNAGNAKLGALGTILFVFAAISMLSRVESTFNDIWGVAHGRNWFVRIVQYWAVLTLGPLLLVAAIGLASGPHLRSTQALLTGMPFLGSLLFQLLPVVVLCIAFSVFYVLMPATKVHFVSALAGGLVGGTLWHLNNALSVLYVSRVVTNSKIYGSLGMIPVFMIGLYFSWLILLFGAQVAYAHQNRAAYLQDRQSENINQRGREFIALRLMQCIGSRFVCGERPATVPEMADGLIVPSRLVQQIMQTLLAAGLVVEVSVQAHGREIAYSPARPIESITCHDILLALRAGKGQELATRDDSARAEVYGEFGKIIEAERKIASGITLLNMVERAGALAHSERKAVTDGTA